MSRNTEVRAILSDDGVEITINGYMKDIMGVIAYIVADFIQENVRKGKEDLFFEELRGYVQMVLEEEN